MTGATAMARQQLDELLKRYKVTIEHFTPLDRHFAVTRLASLLLGFILALVSPGCRA